MADLENNRKDRNSNPRGRPKGYPKTGGRRKLPSKDEINKQRWDDVLTSNRFSIPVEAIRLFFDKDTTNNLKFSILQFLAQYTTPALKPKEADDTEDVGEVPFEALSSSDIISIVSSSTCE